MSVTCDIYKSLRHENLYVYVYQDAGIDHLPADLRARFGEAELALSIELTEQRRLAREDPVQVLANLAEHGYHLQLPPAEIRR